MPSLEVRLPIVTAVSTINHSKAYHLRHVVGCFDHVLHPRGEEFQIPTLNDGSAVSGYHQQINIDSRMFDSLDGPPRMRSKHQEDVTKDLCVLFGTSDDGYVFKVYISENQYRWNRSPNQ